MSVSASALDIEADALRRFVDLVSHRAGQALARMEEAGVTLPQVLLMVRVERAGAASISELAGVSPGSAAAVSQMVDRLVRRDWLARSEDQGDRRRKTVSLTAAGVRLLRDMEAARTADYAAGLSRLPPALRAELHGWLERALAEVNREASQ
ncbi:MAG: MarR family transcriptional regulator [Caulobacteraceae bacterium]|nr:MarR family transcriptional regulator [Caulobacteraceae bacterium]